MSVTLAGIMIVSSLVAAAAVIIGIPLLAGLIAFDFFASRKAAPVVARAPKAERTVEAAQDRIFVERNVARAFVIFGGLFWMAAAFAGLFSFRETGVAWAMLAAFVPFVAATATLIIGWYYERVMSVLLSVASLGVVYAGIVGQYEVGVWVLMTLALIGPMMTASVLFWLARGEQQALELRLAESRELAPVQIAAGPVA